jgi:hypothetical protein
MAVFNASSQTETEIATTSGGGTPLPDYSLPPLGRLQPGLIASRSPFSTQGSDIGLLTITGEDINIVHGDLWEQIGTSNRSGNNVTRNVLGSETQDIQVSETIKIHKNLSQEVYGQTYYLYVDTTDLNHIETVTVNYSNPINSAQPTNWWTAVQSIGMSYDVQLQAGIFNIQFVASNLQFFASQLQIVVWNFNANFVNFNPDGCKLSLWGLDAKINALGNKIHGLETKVGGAIAHAVATTVKTVIVGINQIF